MAVDGWISEKMGEFGRLAGRMTAYILHPTYIVPTYGAKATHVDHVPPGKQQLPVAEGPNTKGQILRAKYYVRPTPMFVNPAGLIKGKLKMLLSFGYHTTCEREYGCPLLLGFKTVSC